MEAYCITKESAKVLAEHLNSDRPVWRLNLKTTYGDMVIVKVSKTERNLSVFVSFGDETVIETVSGPSDTMATSCCVQVRVKGILEYIPVNSFSEMGLAECLTYVEEALSLTYGAEIKFNLEPRYPFEDEYPFTEEERDKFTSYHDANPVWGELHIVLEDLDVDDYHVQRCYDMAKENGDKEAMELAKILMELTPAQRYWLPHFV